MTGPSTPRGTITVHVFGRTDVGRTREHNEDTFAVAELTTFNASLQPEVRQHTLGTRGTLFMVADGMGGAAAGEIASSMAVEAIIEAVKGDRARLTSEAADVLYHLLVMLAARDVTLDEVLAELDRREGTSGIAEKAAR